MTVSITAALGVVFLLLALTSTFLMFKFWGYPYDKDRRKSECPRWKMHIHRAVGYAYLAIYLILMWHMVPRLWQYQIEFPPRTVAHIMLGMSIGVILLIKVSILRWFRHFEEWMPALGVALLLCTVLLLGMSLPFVLRATGGVGDTAFSDDNRARVRELIGGAGFPEGVDLDVLASNRSLQHGRRVLLDECTFCHDLKTAISRPRTPEDWLRTVERMADKPTLGPRLDPDEIHSVSAYLVAITPELQLSAKAKRADAEEHASAVRALEEIETGVATPGESEATDLTADAGPPADAGVGADGAAVPARVEPAVAAKAATRPRPKLDPVRAKASFERVCAKCHPASDTDDEPPRSRPAVDELIARMIENGLEAKKADLALVRAYLVETYVTK